MTFQTTQLNVVNAMNIATGVFNAPKAGTYAFSVTGIKASSNYSSNRFMGYGFG